MSKIYNITMEFTAKQLAEALEGEIIGNSEVKVHTIAKIEEGTAGAISFLANPKYTPYIYSTDSSIVIVNKDFHPEKAIKATLIKVDDAYQGFSKLLEAYNEYKTNKSGIETPSYIAETASLGNAPYIGAFAYIGSNAKIGNNVKIYPQAYIGDNVQIKDNCTIFSGVKIYADTIIGNNCTIHAGTVIGSDGFGFAPQEDGSYKKVPQIGNVILEDNVEIGANTTIDCATMGSTIIKKGVKIDNLVQIAHNVEIGNDTVVAAQTGIAGSAKVGKQCMIGGQVGIAGHLSIADKVKIQAQSGIASNIKKEGEALQGSPAIPIMNFKKSYIYFKKLPDLFNTK